MPSVATAEPAAGDSSLAHLRPVWWAILAACAAMALYHPSLDAGFINLDDPQYVTDNAYILHPSWGKLVAFFTEALVPATVGGYYQPLAMASLMLDRVIDAALVGGDADTPDPFVFHLTNIILHGINVALVFALSYLLVRRRAVALVCALLFAVHPVNVETVAWVSQRKALLATLFALLMLLAYGRYAASRSARWYIATVACFVLSLLAKPTGVLLPIVLIVADAWPLRRISRRALLEKVPLLILAGAGAWVAYESQKTTAFVMERDWQAHPGDTLLIGLFNVAFYPAKTLVPVNLSPQYPMPDPPDIAWTAPPFWMAIVGSAVIAALFVWAIMRRRTPIWTCILAYYLLLGPAASPLRFMGAIAADRFAYLPMIAALVLLAHLWPRRPTVHDAAKQPLPGAATAVAVTVLAVFAYSAVKQQAHWQNSETYYRRILAFYPQAPVAHHGLGAWRLEQHDAWLASDPHPDDPNGEHLLDQALAAFRRTIELNPTYTFAYFDAAHVLLLRDRPAAALDLVERGLAYPHADVTGHFFRGLCYSRLGQYERAIPDYYECIRRKPSWREARRNLANALLRAGRAMESLEHYAALYRLDPTDMDGLQNWAVALITVGRPDAAVPMLHQVIATRTRTLASLDGPARHKQQSALADAWFTLAGIHAGAEQTDAALDALAQAVRLKPDLLDRVRTHPAFADLIQTSDFNERFGTTRTTPQPASD